MTKVMLILVALAALALAWVLRPTPPSISGNYAEDWSQRCGAKEGQAQTACTDELDALYGRRAGVALPPSGY